MVKLFYSKISTIPLQLIFSSFVHLVEPIIQQECIYEMSVLCSDIMRFFVWTTLWEYVTKDGIREYFREETSKIAESNNWISCVPVLWFVTLILFSMGLELSSFKYSSSRGKRGGNVYTWFQNVRIRLSNEPLISIAIPLSRLVSCVWPRPFEAHRVIRRAQWRTMKQWRT